MSFEILKHVYYTKKLAKSFVLPLNIVDLCSLVITSNHTLKQNSHFLYSLCIIYSKQIKYLFIETTEFYNTLYVKPVKKKRQNINLQLLSDLRFDYDSSIFNCFEESCKEYIRNEGDKKESNNMVEANNMVESNIAENDFNFIDYNNIVNENSANNSNFLIDELPQLKKRRVIDNVTEFDSDNDNIFRKVNKKIENVEKVSFSVPYEIKTFFENIKRPSIEVGRNNQNVVYNDETLVNTGNNTYNELTNNLINDISIEVGRIDNESYYEPLISSEEVENIKIEDLPINFIFNAEVLKMSKREKAKLFLQLLQGCSENRIIARQETAFGNIKCEIVI